MMLHGGQSDASSGARPMAPFEWHPPKVWRGPCVVISGFIQVVQPRTLATHGPQEGDDG